MYATKELEPQESVGEGMVEANPIKGFVFWGLLTEINCNRELQQ
jgi:hypothetical protein